MQLAIYRIEQPKSLCVWLFLFASFITLGQLTSSTFSVHGYIKSSDDSVSLEGVHVYIRNTTIGTVSNLNGEFEIRIPENLNYTELVISAIGYKTKFITPKKDSLRDLDIYMIRSSYVLNEIIITSNQLDSSFYILKEAIHMIRFNFPRKNHQLEGFYRDLSTLDTSYTRLIEAAIQVEEVGYNKNTWEGESLTMVKNRIKIIEMRKSDDFRDRDIFTKALMLAFGERNELYQLLGCNYVRILGRKSNHLLSKESLSKFESEYLGQIEWDGKMVYSISLKNQPSKSFQWNEANFLINKNDFGIVRIELNRMANPFRKDIPQESLINGKYFFRSDITYRKIELKYYPVLIHTVSSDYDASNTVTINDKVLKQSSQQIFLLTNLNKDFIKIKSKEAESRSNDLYNIDRPYNENFWKTYNTVLINPLTHSPVELQKKRTLEEQFRDSKKHND